MAMGGPVLSMLWVVDNIMANQSNVEWSLFDEEQYFPLLQPFLFYGKVKIEIILGVIFSVLLVKSLKSPSYLLKTHTSRIVNFDPPNSR